jgi:hypothetical protein
MAIKIFLLEPIHVDSKYELRKYNPNRKMAAKDFFETPLPVDMREFIGKKGFGIKTLRGKEFTVEEAGEGRIEIELKKEYFGLLEDKTGALVVDVANGKTLPVFYTDDISYERHGNTLLMRWRMGALYPNYHVNIVNSEVSFQGKFIREWCKFNKNNEHSAHQSAAAMLYEKYKGYMMKEYAPADKKFFIVKQSESHDVWLTPAKKAGK